MAACCLYLIVFGTDAFYLLYEAACDSRGYYNGNSTELSGAGWYLSGVALDRSSQSSRNAGTLYHIGSAHYVCCIGAGIFFGAYAFGVSHRTNSGIGGCLSGILSPEQYSFWRGEATAEIFVFTVGGTVIYLFGQCNISGWLWSSS